MASIPLFFALKMESIGTAFGDQFGAGMQRGEARYEKQITNETF